MKILAFTDVHADDDMLDQIENKLSKADLLVCTGDIAWLGHGVQEVIERFGSWNKPLLLIHGNHEMMEEVRMEAKKYDNITFLHKKHKIIDNTLFYGYGGDWWEQESKEFEKWIKQTRMPKSKNRVMLVHMPPYKTKQDYLPQWESHRGNMSYKNHIIKEQPNLVLCGHFHETFHMKDKVGNTIIINPGPDGEIIELQ